MTSPFPPWCREDHQVVQATEFLMNLTDPSAIAAFTPPGEPLVARL